MNELLTERDVLKKLYDDIKLNQRISFQEWFNANRQYVNDVVADMHKEACDVAYELGFKEGQKVLSDSLD